MGDNRIANAGRMRLHGAAMTEGCLDRHVFVGLALLLGVRADEISWDAHGGIFWFGFCGANLVICFTWTASFHARHAAQRRSLAKASCSRFDGLCWRNSSRDSNADSANGTLDFAASSACRCSCIVHFLAIPFATYFAGVVAATGLVKCAKISASDMSNRDARTMRPQCANQTTLMKTS